MEKAEFKLGDTSWFYAGNCPGNPITDGKIIHIFEHYFEKLYVIEEKSSIEPNYYVRHSEEMSDSKDKPINLYRESLEQLRKSLEKTLEETQNKLKELKRKSPELIEQGRKKSEELNKLYEGCCEICDSPEDCRSGYYPCNLSGEFLNKDNNKKVTKRFKGV